MRGSLLSDQRWLMPMPETQHTGTDKIMLCFPYGGGGATSFYGLSSLHNVGIATWAVKLPGREERIKEPQATSIKTVIAAIVDELQRLTRPFLFYGHSFGAGLALDVAHALAASGQALPSKLVLSGRMPPHTGYSPLLNTMSDSELWHYVCSESPIALPMETASSFARHTLAKLKSDLALNGQLSYRFTQTLPVPLHTINGLNDPLVETERLGEWSRYTNSHFQSHCLPGGHFFFKHDFQRFYSTLLSAVNEQGN